MRKLRAVSEKGRDVLRQIHPAHRQYLAFPDSTSGRKHLDTYTRKRMCGKFGDSGKGVIFIINCAIKDRKAKKGKI